MVYVILAMVVAALIYFIFRYLSMAVGLKKITEELWDARENLDQNQIVHLPLPNRRLAKLLNAVNALLEGIQSQRQCYEKREKEFMRQIENISHDLRTPLTVILGYLSLIQTDHGDSCGDANSEHADPCAHRDAAGHTDRGSDRELVNELALIGQKARTMEKLVSAFYDYSRISTGDDALNLQQIDAARLLRESLAGNYQLLQQSDLQVNIHIPDRPLWAIGDATALERIFYNLLQNAGRYATAAVDISIEERDQFLWVTFANDADALTQEDVNRLFDRFYTHDRARSQGGTGLGLTIARLLAQQMGGDLTARLAPGNGSGAPGAAPQKEGRSLVLELRMPGRRQDR